MSENNDMLIRLVPELILQQRQAIKIAIINTPADGIDFLANILREGADDDDELRELLDIWWGLRAEESKCEHGNPWDDCEECSNAPL